MKSVVLAAAAALMVWPSNPRLPARWSVNPEPAAAAAPKPCTRLDALPNMSMAVGYSMSRQIGRQYCGPGQAR